MNQSEKRRWRYVFGLAPMALAACGGRVSRAPTRIVQVAAGSHQACALLSTGTVSCWGYVGPQTDAAGLAVDTSHPVPTPVSGLGNVKFLSLGDFFACAVLSNGTVACWGDDLYGQLGVDAPPETYTYSINPLLIPNFNEVSTVAAGGIFGCALHSSGTVACWGPGVEGELGDGMRTNTTIPQTVSGISDAVAIAAGYGFACALHRGGTVDCWGDTQNGEAGAIDVTEGCPPAPPAASPACDEFFVPMPIPGLSNIRAIAAGHYFACALQADGTVACWGSDEYGQIGSAPQAMCGFPCSPTPSVVPNLGNVTAITAGDEFACALIADGTVRCWGFNADGQLGDGTTVNSMAPVAVSGLSDVVAISASTEGDFACALTSSQAIECWGLALNGQLGVLGGSSACDGGPCSTVPVAIQW